LWAVETPPPVGGPGWCPSTGNNLECTRFFCIRVIFCTLILSYIKIVICFTQLINKKII
jgi:hypothetical protein